MSQYTDSLIELESCVAELRRLDSLGIYNPSDTVVTSEIIHCLIISDLHTLLIKKQLYKPIELGDVFKNTVNKLTYRVTKLPNHNTDGMYGVVIGYMGVNEFKYVSEADLRKQVCTHIKQR